MGHEHRRGHMLQYLLRHTAQDQFPESVVPVSTHHQQIGLLVGHNVEQQIAFIHTPVVVK